MICVFINSCNYRTPSKIRFEKITKISLSDSITITEDRFEDSGPDYGLFYKVILEENECAKILKFISESKDWKKDENKWRFYKREDGIIYDIAFSEYDCQISYSEDLI